MYNYLLIEPGFYSTWAARHKAGVKFTPEEGFTEAPILEINDDFAVITIEGVLSPEGPGIEDIFFGEKGTAYSEIIDSMQEADALLEEGKPIYLDVNTPGGTVIGVEETYVTIRDIASRRPVITRVRGMLASAGVWITAGSTEIRTMGEADIIGSVGVAVTVADFTGAYEEFGIKVIDLTNTDSPDKRPDVTSDDGQAVIRRELDGIFSIFKKDLLAGRAGRLDESKLLALKGACVVSAEALEIGFIDAIDKNIDNLAQKVQTTTQGVVKMNLEQLLNENPEAKEEFHALLEGAREDEKKAAVDRVETLGKYLVSESYPSAVKENLLKGISGERSVEAALDFVSFYDSAIAAKKVEVAEEETEAVEDTPAEPVVEDKNSAIDERISRIKSYMR